jgi:hypothetical protein
VLAVKARMNFWLATTSSRNKIERSGHRPDSTLRPKLLRRLYLISKNLAKLSPKYLDSFFGDRLTEEGASDYSHHSLA